MFEKVIYGNERLTKAQGRGGRRGEDSVKA